MYAGVRRVVPYLGLAIFASGVGGYFFQASLDTVTPLNFHADVCRVSSA